MGNATQPTTGATGAGKHLDPGVWGVLATPFSGRELVVDPASLEREVELYHRVGATGLVALGVFGEAARLDAREQRQVVEVVRQAGENLPIVVGIPARATAPAVEQAVSVSDAAGDALAGVMVQVHTTDPQRLHDHLRAVHDATGAGIVVQDYPAISGVRIPQETLASVVASCDFVAAIKSESPPTAPAVALLTDRTRVPVFGGLGGVGLLDELAAGAAGAMTGFSYPEGLQAALTAWTDGGFEAARAAFRDWLPLVNFEAQAGIGLAIRKESLRRRGVFTEAGVRPPGAAMPASLAALLEQHAQAVAEQVG